jgi:serine/threonine-protein kinase RsbW
MKAAGECPVRFTINSDFSEGREVQKQILDEIERQGFDSHSAFAVKLAVDEALNNAIKHGNRLAKGKKIHIQATITPEKAEIIVEDEGPGFDRRNVPDPTLQENLEKCSGRGILLMEAYMDQVNYSQNGRRVHMIKFNEPEAQ